MLLSASTVFQSMRSPATERGELHVALSHAGDNFLNVARDALQLNFGEIAASALGRGEKRFGTLQFRVELALEDAITRLMRYVAKL